MATTHFYNDNTQTTGNTMSKSNKDQNRKELEWEHKYVVRELTHLLRLEAKNQKINVDKISIIIEMLKKLKSGTDIASISDEINRAFQWISK